MIRKYFFTFFLLSISFVANSQKYGQKAIDSLNTVLQTIKIDSNKIITLNLIASEYVDNNVNKSFTYCQEALKLSKKIKWTNGISSSLIIFGQNYLTLGDVKKADAISDQALKFAKGKSYISNAIHFKGSLALRKANHSKALEYFFKSLKINTEIKYKKGIANSYYAIGTSYNQLLDNKKALLYIKKALLLSHKYKLKKITCNNLIVFGEIYRDFYKKNQDKKYGLISLNYFFKALNLGTEIENKFIIAHANSKIAQHYEYNNEYDLSLKYINDGKKVAQEISNKRLINNYKLDEALIYLLQFEQDSLKNKKFFLLEKAEPLLIDALQSFRKSKDTYNVGVCYDFFTYLYQLQGKDKKATLMALKFAEIRDSIFTEQSKETVKNLEDQRTIELKNKEIQINKIILEKKEKQKWIYIFGIGFLCILGGLLFYQNQNRKKTNEKLQVLNNNLDQANKTKIKFLSILNHDLRSPVYNFIHFMQLQKESPELLDVNTKMAIENKTILSAENLLFSMEDLLLWSKGELENFEPKFKLTAINDIFNYTKKHFDSEQKVTISFENPENLIVNTDENFLKTIVRNLTGNAIKALNKIENPIIIWKVFKENNKTFLSITDNGSGATQENFKALYDDSEVVGINTGLGLHLIRDLAKAIDCEISVDSKIGAGTTFILKL